MPPPSPISFKLATVQDPDGAEDKKRPPRSPSSGEAQSSDFEGVIESISTKYTMFLFDGTPVRATCRLAIREAGRLGVVKP
jgi:Contractile injection system tube protein